jgi:hypothetical protein
VSEQGADGTAEGGPNDEDQAYEADDYDGYNPRVAIPLASRERARTMAAEAADVLASATLQDPHPISVLALSARKSAARTVDEMWALLHRIEELARLALAEAADPGAGVDALDELIERFAAMEERRDLVRECAPHMVCNSVPASNASPPEPPQLYPAGTARQVIRQRLSSWTAAHVGRQGAQPGTGGAQSAPPAAAPVLVLRTTPGAGKTHAMLQEAYNLHLAGKQVVFAARTKEAILPPEGETYQRLVSSAYGRIRLAVLTGRDETNCQRIDAVRLASDHGYSAAHAVCRKCEHYPDNHKTYGLAMCDYYQSRALADAQARAARKGWNKQFPLVLTTHALAAINARGAGGRLGAVLANPDVLFIDEDPTEAFETEVALTEAQCSFVSLTPATTKPHLLSQLLAEAISIAKEGRRDARRAGWQHTGAREQGEKRPEGQGVHTEHGSYYTSADLHCLLQEAAKKLARRLGTFPPLPSLLRDIEMGEGFGVDAGQLLNARNVTDIHQQGVPPKAMQHLAEGIQREMQEYMKFRRETLFVMHPRLNVTIDDDFVSTLVERTDIGDCCYAVRLECAPAPADGGPDAWRFAYRRREPVQSRETPIVIGDAYAQQEHYEYIFERPVQVEQVAVRLHPGARFVRVAYPHASISALRTGELPRVLAIAESALLDAAKPGDRVLVYGHEALRPQVEAWLDDMRHRIGLADVAYEHWWGGRGKDHYSGWEFTIAISNPTLNVGGLQHAANARQFDAFASAKSTGLTPAQYHDLRDTLSGRECIPANAKRGMAQALRCSTPGVWREHLRMGIGELTQAIHRSRPVHHPTAILIIGETELDSEVIAQTDAVLLPTSRQVEVDASRQKSAARDTSKPLRIEGGYCSMVTRDEVYTAIRALVCHYSFYTPWFGHSLAQPPVDPGKAQWFRKTPTGQLITNLVTSRHLPEGVAGSHSVGTSDPVAHRADTLAQRAWDPTPNWEQGCQERVAPRAVTEVHQEVFGARVCVRPEARAMLGMGNPLVIELPWPRWAKASKWHMRRTKPKILFDGALYAGADVRRIASEMLETQYGPTVDGRLIRPDYDPVMPVSLGSIPF